MTTFKEKLIILFSEIPGLSEDINYSYEWESLSKDIMQLIYDECHKLTKEFRDGRDYRIVFMQILEEMVKECGGEV